MIARYLRELARHAINVFSAVSLLLAFATLLLFRLGDATNALVLTFAACLSVLLASFYAWKEAIKKCPQVADLSIVYKSCKFGSSGTRGGVPTSPVRFSIMLDAINRGQEPAVLTNIRVVKFNMNNKLLSNQPSSVEMLLPNAPLGYNQVNYPFTIDGGQRIPSIECQLKVNLVRTFEPIEFAKSLGEFQHYEIELEYDYEDMSRINHTYCILVQESFDEYRRERLKEWSTNEHLYGLAIEALRTMGRLDFD